MVPPLTVQNVGVAAIDLLFIKLAEIGRSLNTVSDADFEPRLAAEWEFLDSTTISFSLDERARWHDGRPVTAN
ncbi:MAG: peptide ABC transporter substrate-binding protein, partial [Gemmatimonadales bacterium]